MADLAIVIVNYRARDLLRECLASVAACQGPAPDVIVVDNASGDGSVDMVRGEFPAVSVQGLSENIGYGPANNLGIRQALSVSPAPAYILLLNPDTALPPDALQAMRAFLKRTPHAGAVGPRLVRPDGSLDKACRRGFPTPEVALYHFLYLDRLLPRSPRFGRYNMSFLDPGDAAEVDSLVGACMLIRTEALQQAGLFDEAFFMYGEDLDLCYRIKGLGWKVWYDPATWVLHHKGASSRQNSAKANYEFYRAMLLFHRKHFAADTFFLVNWMITAAVLAKGGWAMLLNAVRPRVGSA